MALGLLVASGAVWQYRVLVRTKSELSSELAETGLADSRRDVVESLRREPDPLAAQMLVSRALLAEVLEAPFEGATAEQTQSRRLDLLTRARRLAESRLEAQPTSWAGLFVRGATIYLERSLLEDDRLLTQYRDWEAPLEQAHRIAPNEPDPQRFLTMAYLEIWPMLSEAKRDLTRSMLETAFSDRRVFNLFIEPWLLVAGDGLDALEPLPSEPYVWDGVKRIFARDRKWPLVAEAHRRWVDAMDLHLQAQIEEGEARLSGGDFRHAEDRFLYVMSMLPLDVKSVPAMTTTLERLPPGPVKPGTAQHARRWLLWHLERCLYQSCLLPQTAQVRLRQMAGELEPATLARSHLAASDLFAAQQVELASAVISEEWSLYWLQKVPLQLARGEATAARESLARVRGELRSGPLFARRLLQVEQAARLGGEPDSSDSAAPESLARPSATTRVRRSEWLQTDWQQSPGRAPRLLLWPALFASTMLLEFAATGSESGVVEVVWDGVALGTFAIDPSEPQITVAVQATEDVHVLELRSLGGRTQVPESVRMMSGI